ncbi:MAG: hypothetical protein LIO53_02140 [Oscillospiraceae bacterium]|nr:hypothetical protein [Oscillospiraceae bacterium]
MRVKKVEDKYQSIKDIEKSIYGNVLVIITIFLGLFSLLSFEITAVQSMANSVINILRYNLIYLSSISLLICTANLILPYGNNKKLLPFIIPAVCIVLSIIMTFAV